MINFVLGFITGGFGVAAVGLWLERHYPSGWFEVHRCSSCDRPMSYDHQGHSVLLRPRDCSGTARRLCPHCGIRFDIFDDAKPAVGRFRWLRWEWKEPKGSVQ